jgi:hypothetical protein
MAGLQDRILGNRITQDFQDCLDFVYLVFY